MLKKLSPNAGSVAKFKNRPSRQNSSENANSNLESTFSEVQPAQSTLPEFGEHNEYSIDTALFNKPIHLNVSGRKYDCTLAQLLKYPDSTLGNSFYRDRYYDKHKDEFFFDRHIATFEAVLECLYLKDQPLTRPPEIHLDVFLEEIRYYRLPAKTLEEYLLNEGIGTQLQQNDPDSGEKVTYAVYAELRWKLWLLFDDPTSSFCARLLSFWSIFAIVLSIMVFCLETLEPVTEKCSKVGGYLFIQCVFQKIFCPKSCK